jgi:transposase
MAAKYSLTLTAEERQKIEQFARPGKTESRKYVRARALLLCDAGVGGPVWSVADISQALGITGRAIEKIKKRFVEKGLNAVLERKPSVKPSREVQFDEEFEARLLEMACSAAPEGYARWTVRLLADKAVELNLASSVSHSTVQRILKKANHASGNIEAIFAETKDFSRAGGAGRNAACGKQA